MKIGLISDFLDYYDNHFENRYFSNFIWKRLSTGGLSRLEILKFLNYLGFNTPIFGTIGEVADHIIVTELYNSKDEDIFFKFTEVVIYDDLQAHKGEGKKLLTLEKALETNPQSFCSVYMRSLIDGSRSNRYLQIGNRAWTLLYESPDWRSNVGDVKISVLDEMLKIPEWTKKIQEPLFAIDLVPVGSHYYAIDFNIAPQIKGTGLEEILKPEETAMLIKNALINLKK